MPTLEDFRSRLTKVGQEHLLTFAAQISPTEQAALAGQIAAIDLEALPALINKYVLNPEPARVPHKIDPAPFYPADPTSKSRPWDKAKHAAAGEALLRAGKIAAFVVAGGQGSRLGFEGPKGCYPAGAVTEKPLFQIFAEQLLAAHRRFGKPVSWYIMTSPLNHAATEAFFEQHNFFGLSPADVVFLQQGVMPSFDIKTGKILLASRSEIATNPDGHGGSITALHRSGALADMKRRGIEHLSYFQVDNPHVKIIDPVFIGLHAAAPDSSAEMSSKMLPKASASEKVGVFCVVDGRLDMIEYSDLPAELAGATNPDGTLKFIAGNPAIHILAVKFVEKLTSGGAELPYHRAEKKIPAIDLRTGELVAPTANNGVKLEKFVFDALQRAEKSLVFETDRLEEFAPIKNATGADSVESSKKLQTQRAARWLEAAGVRVPRTSSGDPDCIIELSPLTALFPEDLKSNASSIRIEPGSKVTL